MADRKWRREGRRSPREVLVVNVKTNEDETAVIPWYDSKEGFEKALKGGLDGLRKIAKERGTAGYDRKERLTEWVVLGYFYFDVCGNTMKITEGRPDYHTFGKELPRVLTKEELDKGKRHGWMTTTMCLIPPSDEVCPRCLEGWDLRNYADYKSSYDYDTETRKHCHQKCHDLKVLQNETIFFEKIIADSQIKYTEIRLIPREYHDRPAPWFMIETEKGPVKIGYRRRVISIEWPHAEGLKNVDGSKLFKDEGTTAMRTYVHAWGAEKAVEYLQKLIWGDLTGMADCMSYCRFERPHGGKCIPMEGR